MLTLTYQSKRRIKATEKQASLSTQPETETLVETLLRVFAMVPHTTGLRGERFASGSRRDELDAKNARLWDRADYSGGCHEPKVIYWESRSEERRVAKE